MINRFKESVLVVENRGTPIQVAALIGVVVILLVAAVFIVVYFLWNKMRSYQAKHKSLEKHLTNIEERHGFNCRFSGNWSVQRSFGARFTN